jgi:chromosome segregation ATPase
MRKIRCDDRDERLSGCCSSKRLLIGLRLLVLAATTLPPCAAQQTGDASAWLQFIGMELRQLRVELLEKRVAEEGDKLLQIERDVASLRMEQSKHQNREQSEKRQLAELDKHANDPGTDPQARANIQVTQGELASSVERMHAAYTSLNAREAELNERLQAAKARLQSLTGRLKQLTAHRNP